MGARLHNNPEDMTSTGNNAPLAHALTGRVKSRDVTQSFPRYHNVMAASGTTTTRNSWVDLTSYEDILNEPQLAALSANLTSEGPCENAQSGEFETIVVYGMPVEIDGLARMQTTVMTYPWCTPVLSDAPKPNVKLALEVEEPSGRVRTHKTVVEARTIYELTEGGHMEQLGPFSAPIPVPAGSRVRSLSVDGLEGKIGSTTMKPSENAPKVGFKNYPAGGLLKSETVIYWSAEDDDKHATLDFQVVYSPNGGIDFMPLAACLKESKLVIDGTKLPSTEPGQGLIRVFVNDGMHTAFADLEGLSIENGAPQVLEFPATTFGEAGLPLEVTVSAFDPNGDSLRFHWTFPDGKAKTTSTPKIQHIFSDPGVHTIKVNVVDPSGASATASQKVSIKDQPKKTKRLETPFPKFRYE